MKLQSRLNVLVEVASRARTRTMDWEAVRPSLAPDISRLDVLELGLIFPNGTIHYVSDDSTATLATAIISKRLLVECLQFQTCLSAG
jgi:methyl-accepting chemotaxis protein